MTTLIGYDPGRDESYGAVAVMEQRRVPRTHPNEAPPDDRRTLEQLLAQPVTTYRMQHLERLPRQWSHAEHVNRVVELWSHPKLPLPKILLLDATGMGGRIVLDMFKLAKVRPVPVVWHGGDATTYAEGLWRVGKATMVAKLVALVETERLKLHPEVLFGEAMVAEMRQYLKDQNETTGRERFYAGSTGAYDDLISASVMCAWHGERTQPAYMVPYKV